MAGNGNGRGRPTKFTPEKGELIAERLRAGSTRKAAAESVGVWYTTLLDWLQRGAEAKSGQFHDFHDAVQRAEADAEVRNAAILQKAANGWDAGKKIITRKTVFKPRKITRADGTVIEESVPHEEVTETTHEERLFDWRAAESWLKRRHPEAWGDRIDVKNLPDDILVRLLNRAAAERGGAPEGAGAGEPEAVGAGTRTRNGKH